VLGIWHGFRAAVAAEVRRVLPGARAPETTPEAARAEFERGVRVIVLVEILWRADRRMAEPRLREVLASPRFALVPRLKGGVVAVCVDRGRTGHPASIWAFTADERRDIALDMIRLSPPGEVSGTSASKPERWQDCRVGVETSIRGPVTRDCVAIMDWLYAHGHFSNGKLVGYTEKEVAAWACNGPSTSTWKAAKNHRPQYWLAPQP
jgi:hypothetical protein